jgi:hypothetical protein
MKSWERDLLDHLVWLKMMHEEGAVSRDEAVAAVKREFPSLAVDRAPAKPIEHWLSR